MERWRTWRWRHKRIGRIRKGQAQRWTTRAVLMDWWMDTVMEDKQRWGVDRWRECESSEASDHTSFPPSIHASHPVGHGRGGASPSSHQATGEHLDRSPVCHWHNHTATGNLPGRLPHARGLTPGYDSSDGMKWLKKSTERLMES